MGEELRGDDGEGEVSKTFMGDMWCTRLIRKKQGVETRVESDLGSSGEEVLSLRLGPRQECLLHPILQSLQVGVN